MSLKEAKPFLKWAGGKTQLLSYISKDFPYSKDEIFHYVEPFVGSGAVLFWVLNNFKNVDNIVINDLNIDLVNTYKTIKNNVEELIIILKTYQEEYHFLVDNEGLKKEYYYNKRDLFNSEKTTITEQSALFIFLNKTCFNGLYRVNKTGGFNVPIGSYKKPLICDEDNLRLVNKALQKVIILNGDFEGGYFKICK